MKCGEMIRARLEEVERSPACLAPKIGVHRAQVSRWVTLAAPVPAHRHRDIALAPGKPADWLTVAQAGPEPVAA